MSTTAGKKTASKASAGAVPAKAAKKPSASSKPSASKKAVGKTTAGHAAEVSPAPAAKKVSSPVESLKKAPSPAGKADAPSTVAAPVAASLPTTPPGEAPLIPRKGRGTPKYFVAPVSAPLPPPTSRFADRFAPPRPPTRQMNKPDDATPREKHKADPKLANAWKTKAGKALSDAEVLAMPDDEYMNDKQVDFFRMKLEQLKNDLLSNADETTEHLREDTSIVPDPADRATIEEEHALELRTRDRERKLLKKISQSLARLESGEYGFCDETGEPIGIGRLIARPTATLSLEAQQRRELKQKMFGD